MTLSDLCSDLHRKTQAFTNESRQQWRNRVLKAVERGQIPQVRVEVDGKSRFYPVESGS